MSADAGSLLHSFHVRFKNFATAFWWYTVLAVLAFVFVWSPQVFYLSGRYLFHFNVEPRCALELPSEFSELGFVIGPGVEDMPAQTRKPLVGNFTAEECIGLHVVNSSWEDSIAECSVHIEVSALHHIGMRRITVPMVKSAEYGVVTANTCALLQHPRTKSHWLFEDLCVRGQSVSVINDWRDCTGNADKYLRGRPAFGVKGDASRSAWLHVLGGNLYFILGLLQFRFTGHQYPSSHKRIGHVYAALNILIYFSTIIVTLYTAPNIVRAILNVLLINNYWMFTLVAAIRAIRNGDKAAHRAWMMRNFSVAFAIVTGRYWGSVLVFLLWPFYVNGTSATDGNILLASAAHAVMVEFFLNFEKSLSSIGSMDSSTEQKTKAL
eukprot:TRINITY_DN58668_c0_g1_i1.p1 TRINITY_DN58668_c0_g1~~TRINITY_DN58668_c0_g1_i1.p1  ORF type:complete len:388 (-),score=26.80 TRINITY_DN58668_c0_g1_i1:13-1152(-)